MLVSSRVIVLALLAASPAAGFTLQSPSLRASRHPTRAASVTMAAGEDRPCLATTRRSALAAAAGILLANPSPSSAGGMASEAPTRPRAGTYALRRPLFCCLGLECPVL